MNFFRCLCLCFGAMMFLGAVRGKCMEPKPEGNNGNCVICGKKSEMDFIGMGVVDANGNFCELKCFKKFLIKIMTEKEVNDLYIHCSEVPGYPKDFILRAVRFKKKNNALVVNKGSKGYFFEIVENRNYSGALNGVLNGIEC